VNHDDDALLNGEASPAARSIILTVAQHWASTGKWPIWQFVEDRLSERDEHDLRPELAAKALQNMPLCGGQHGASYGYIRKVSRGPVFSDEDPVELTVAVGLVESDLEMVLGRPFLDVLHHMIQIYVQAPADPDKPKEVRLTSEGLAKAFPDLEPAFIARLPDILSGEPATWGGSKGSGADGSWWHDVPRRVLGYREVVTLRDYVETTIQELHRTRSLSDPGSQLPAAPRGRNPLVPSAFAIPGPASAPAAGPYIDAELVDELEKAGAQSTWDVKKLVAVLRELNSNVADAHPFASQALVRVVMDHIPPAFSQTGFAAVANGHTWGRTDGRYAKSLLNYRFTGDDVMHRQIRKTADRISMDDMPPRAWLNAILSELLDVLQKDVAAASSPTP